MRSIINMLSDERTAHVDLAKLRDAAKERRMLLVDLIALVSSAGGATRPQLNPGVLRRSLTSTARSAGASAPLCTGSRPRFVTKPLWRGG